MKHSLINSMKNIPSVPLKKIKFKSAEIIAKISSAQKLADIAKKKAQAAKVVFKRARKAYKLTKKAAKTARSEVKDLKKVLETAKRVVPRKKVVKTRKASTVRKPSRAKSAAIELPAVMPTTAVAEVVVSTGDVVEQV